MLADFMGKEVVQPNAEVVHLNDKTEVAPVIRMIEKLLWDKVVPQKMKGMTGLYEQNVSWMML